MKVNEPGRTTCTDLVQDLRLRSMWRVDGLFRGIFHAVVGLVFMLACIGMAAVPEISHPGPQARFTTFEEARLTLDQYRQSGLAGSRIETESEWYHWIRAQDAAVRARIDRGVEDSVSNFILYGVSFTKLPRLSGSEDALDERGSVTAAARARTRALVVASGRRTPGERVEFVREFRKQRRVPPADFDNYLISNLVRFAQEQRAYQKTLDDAGRSQDTNEVMSVRGTLYKERGLSADTSLLPNLAIDETL